MIHSIIGFNPNNQTRMLNHNYISFYFIALLILSCAPGSYHLKRNYPASDRNSSHSITHKNNNFNNQNINFSDNYEKNIYDEYESNHTSHEGKIYYYEDDKRSNTDNKIIPQKEMNYHSRSAIANENKTYTIRKGDNLYKIAKKFNTTADEIVSLNKIMNRNKIYSGMILKIPETKIRTDKSTARNFQRKKTNPKFIWPLKDVHSAKRDGLEGVRSIGIIITGKNNTSVFSSADGVVKKIGHMRGFGNYIILKHKNKFLTIYSNLKNIKVNEGDIIEKGKRIGSLDGDKLHFQIGYAGKPEDPLLYLSEKS